MKKIFLAFVIVAVAFISCEEVFFVTDISKETVKLIAPSNDAIFDVQEVNLNWERIEDAEEYQVQIVNPSFLNSSQLLKDTILTANTFVTTLTPNKYQWRVRGINSGYNTAYSTYNFEITSLNPEDVVTLVSPEDKLITNQTEHLLRWEPITYAASYNLLIWAPNTSGTLIEEIEIDTTETLVNFEEGLFIWQVSAQNNDRTTKYFSRELLVDTTPPNTAELETPLNELETSSSLIDFSWKRTSIKGSSEIDSLFIYLDTALTQLFYKEEVTNSNAQLNVASNEYFWFVKSYDKAGNESENSIVNSFTVLSSIENQTVELVSPENELITNISKNVFQWNPIENATQYQIEVLQQNITAPIIFTTSTTEVEKEITLQDGFYKWQVKALNDFQETEFSERSILIDTEEPNTPELVTPIDGHTQKEKIIRLLFNRTPRSGSTEVDSLFVFTDQNLTTLNLKTKVVDMNNFQEFEIGTYYWFVKSYDEAGNESNQSEIHNFTIEANFTEKEVELTSPQDELITNMKQQSLNWLSVADAIDYRVQIHETDNSSVILQDFTLPITTKTVTLEDGYYTWQVRAQNANQNTAYFSRNILIDSTAPKKPTLSSPSDLAILNNTTVQFIWSLEENSGSNELSTISVYNDAGLSDLLFSEQVNGISLFKDITSGTYYWQIEVVDAAGNKGEKSNIYSFTVN